MPEKVEFKSIKRPDRKEIVEYDVKINIITKKSLRYLCVMLKGKLLSRKQPKT